MTFSLKRLASLPEEIVETAILEAQEHKYGFNAVFLNTLAFLDREMSLILGKD